MMKFSLIFITFFMCFPLFLCTAKNVSKRKKGYYDVIIYSTIDYHIDANGMVYQKRIGNDRMEAKLHYHSENIDDKKDKNVFFIDVKYNKKVKK